MPSQNNPEPKTEVQPKAPLHTRDAKPLIVAAAAIVVVGAVLVATYLAGAMSHRMVAGFGMKPGEGMMRGRMGGHHGRPAPAASGSVTAVDGNAITVKTNGNNSIKVTTSDATIIVKDQAVIQLSSVKTGDTLVVMGVENSDKSVSAQRIIVNPKAKNSNDDATTQSMQGDDSAPSEAL